MAVIAPQVEEIEPVAPDDHPAEPAPPRKIKRARLLLDVRTELTDDELKVCSNAARDLQLQLVFLYRLHACIIWKNRMVSIDNLHGGILRRIKAGSLTVCFGLFRNTVSFDFVLALIMSLHFEVQAKELVDFWLDHFKAQLDARSVFMIGPRGQCYSTLSVPY